MFYLFHGNSVCWHYSNPSTQWDFFGRSWSLMIFHWLFRIQYQLLLSTWGACLEVVLNLNEEQPISARWGLAKLILAPSGSQMNQCRMFFVQTSTLPPCMHRVLTEYGRCCMQNNSLLTKSPVELEENSTIAGALSVFRPLEHIFWSLVWATPLIHIILVAAMYLLPRALE